jgi:hypothetical protein
VSRALALLLVLAAPALHAQGRAPSYGAAQFRCARYQERSVSDIVTESGTRRAGAHTGRSGELILAGVPRTDGVQLLAWYDLLAVWRLAAGDSIAPDTDGVLGGRFRGALSGEGRYVGAERPFVPDPVRELSDVAGALDDLLPPLPPRLLQVGEAFRASDSLGIQRLADSAGLQRYRVEREVAGRVPPAAGDTLTPPFDRSVRDVGAYSWHPDQGLQRFERRLDMEVMVPQGGAVKRAVRSEVAQRVTLVRLGEDAGACTGLTPADFE